MKELKQKDFREIFIGAIQYEYEEDIRLYFKNRYTYYGVINKLFKQGLLQAFKYFEALFESQFTTEISKWEPTNRPSKKPKSIYDIPLCLIPSYDFSHFNGGPNYRYADIIRIKKVLDELFEDSKANLTFPEYLRGDNCERLAELLKKEFKTEKGKKIMMVFVILQEMERFIMVKGQFSAIIRSMETYFGRSIGTFSGINIPISKDPRHMDFEGLEATRNRIRLILNKIEEENNN